MSGLCPFPCVWDVFMIKLAHRCGRNLKFFIYRSSTFIFQFAFEGFRNLFAWIIAKPTNSLSTTNALDPGGK